MLKYFRIKIIAVKKNVVIQDIFYIFIHLEADLSRLGDTLPSFVSLGGDGDFDFSLLSERFFLALLGDRLRFLRGDRLFLRLLDRLLRLRSLFDNILFLN